MNEKIQLIENDELQKQLKPIYIIIWINKSKLFQALNYKSS